MDLERSATGYASIIGALLPSGAAWGRAPESMLSALSNGIAQEFARIDARVLTLQREAYPDTALELLGEWESLVGIPDDCFTRTDTTFGRQIAAARKLSAVGGQSRAYLIDQAAQIGIDIVIEEFAPFTCESACDDFVRGDDWRFAFLVRVVPPSEENETGITARVSYFTCESGCDEALDNVEIGPLECLIKRAAPAHMIPLFAYEVDPQAALYFDFTEGN